MRLIDADRLENVDFSECMDSMEIMAVIDVQPTAYDVDKVIRRMKEDSVTVDNLRIITLDNAIEIVRKESNT